MGLTRNTSRSLQRQIDLTTAVCQERLLAAHVRHVLAFVDLVAPEIAFDSALDMYARILRLTPEQARNVGSRALAALGRRSGVPAEDLEMTFGADEGDDADDAPGADDEPSGGRFDAIFGRVRRRIRGRVHEDLRHRISLAAARAEDDLFNTHVANALIFARALSEEVPLHEAMDLYLDVMAIPEGVSGVVFNRALRTVADASLPPVAESRAAETAALPGATV